MRVNRALAAVVACVALVGTAACESLDSGTAVKDKSGGKSAEKTTAAASSEDEDDAPPPPPTPKPDAKYGQSCDYVLGDFSEYSASGFRFIADANLTNTGNIGVVVSVKASWTQVGTKPIVMTKTIKVPTGAKRRVAFTKQVGQNEIDLIQSADYNHQCKVVATITDTFGEAS
jgi:hypothetical protein